MGFKANSEVATRVRTPGKHDQPHQEDNPSEIEPDSNTSGSYLTEKYLPSPKFRNHGNVLTGLGEMLSPGGGLARVQTSGRGEHGGWGVRGVWRSHDDAPSPTDLSPYITSWYSAFSL